MQLCFTRQLVPTGLLLTHAREMIQSGPSCPVDSYNLDFNDGKIVCIGFSAHSSLIRGEGREVHFSSYFVEEFSWQYIAISEIALSNL